MLHIAPKSGITESYPKQDASTNTETLVSINPQALLILKMCHLTEFFKNSLCELTPGEKSNCQLFSKWGRDGPSQAHFKQRFESPDGHVFQCSFVPLMPLFILRESRKDYMEESTAFKPKILSTNPIPLHRRDGLRWRADREPSRNRMKLFEFFLHLSCKIPLGNNQTRTDVNREGNCS